MCDNESVLAMVARWLSQWQQFTNTPQTTHALSSGRLASDDDDDWFQVDKLTSYDDTSAILTHL